MKKITPKRIYAFLASYGLSVVLLLLMALLTFIGTLEEVNQGLYAVQKKYFESMFVVHHVFGVIPVPLPGVYLLLILAFINMVCGAVFRARKGWRQAGLLIAHLGIIALLASAFFSYHFSVRGNVTLYEGERASEFQSSEAWEIALAPVATAGPVTEYVVPEADFAGRARDGAVTFRAESVPFDLTLSGYAPHAQPMAADVAHAAMGKVVDGFLLQALARDRDVERNIPGVYATVTDRATGAVTEGILWGIERFPWTVTAGGQTWMIDLRRRTWSLPCTIQLDKFTHEVHPGTGIPKAFVSDVTKIDGDVREQARISMNAPLRYKGYTLYQASWGPPDAKPGEPLYSSLAVVRNPAEKLPLYTCAVICFGLLIHFCLRLGAYLRAEARRRA